MPENGTADGGFRMESSFTLLTAPTAITPVAPLRLYNPVYSRENGL